MADEDKRQDREKPEFWLDQLSSSESWLEHFIKRGKDAVKQYEDEREYDMGYNQKRYNLFWQNVDIQQAALYANAPQIEVKRRFKDESDDTGRIAAQTMERLLGPAHIHTDEETEEDPCEDAVQDFLIPGLGQTWFRYEPTFRNQTDEVGNVLLDPETGEPLREIDDEEIVEEYVYWNDFRWSPVRKWRDVWWVARRTHLTRRDAIARFGKKTASQLQYNEAQPSRAAKAEGDDPLLIHTATAEVWEIWDKRDRVQRWVAPGARDILDRAGDPYGLEGYFPCPKPLMANTNSKQLIPRPDWYMLKDQYMELDKANTRIYFLVDSLKAAGIYDSTATAIQQLFSVGRENRLVPVEDWDNLKEKGGTKGLIEWVPIEQFAAVLERLVVHREELKATIYELLGIADIMRGTTAPREGKAVAEMKAHYSSVRLQKKQKAVAKFVRQGKRIEAELICRLFQPETIMAKSLQGFLPEQRDMLMEAVGLLKNERMAKMRLTVEEESMVIPDWSQERASRIEFATSMGQMFSQAREAIAASPSVGLFALETLKWVAAGFKSGRKLEGMLDQAIDGVKAEMQAPKPPSPEQVQQQLDRMEIAIKEFDAQTKRLKVLFDREDDQVDNAIGAQDVENRMRLGAAQSFASLATTKMKSDAEIEKSRLGGGSNGS